MNLKSFKQEDPKQPDQNIRKEILENDLKKGTFDVVVTTYQALEKSECFSFFKKTDWNYIIFDEAHKLKNDESRTAQKSSQINTDNRLLLTGTPLQNNIGELWSLLNMLMPKMFGSKEQFNEWFDFGKY